ncbi:MAG: antibiotic biosynthesis monooxygenase [Bacteroidetes bacterium]|nr:antibiotic biosynthesis monooxygenase [Bacteroidota bacterium]
MITRIVRLSFKKEYVVDFINAFNASKVQICSFPGCTNLRLYKDFSDDTIFYTHSKWNSMEDLENYRKSELFAATWSVVKPLFNESPQVYSLVESIHSPEASLALAPN